MPKYRSINSEDATHYAATIEKNGDDDKIIERAREILRVRMMRKSEPFDSPARVRNYISLQLGGRDDEVFCCVYLDNRHRVIAFDELFRGTIDGTAVYPRVVLRAALAHNAAAVIFAHNHPSGVADPSRADELLTQRLKDALSLVDIRTLDHLIVGDGAIVSMAERGLI